MQDTLDPNEENEKETCQACGEESDDVIDGYCADCRRDLGLEK